jgi:deazaflavin-dependent oxidoreductase (nitroreductase family)
MRFITAVHEFWYRMTDGLIGGSFMGTPMLLLTTTGRKTGKRHTTPLVYLEDGDDIIVIASNGGSDRDPQWWLNLVARPEASIQVGRRREDVRAEAAAVDERTRLWEKISSRYGQYEQYRRRTTREIPVVRLRPRRD